MTHRERLVRILALLALVAGVLAVPSAVNAQDDGGDGDGDASVANDVSSPGDVPEDDGSGDGNETPGPSGEGGGGDAASDEETAALDAYSAGAAARAAGDQAAFDAAVATVRAVDPALADSMQNDWDEAAAPAPAADEGGGGANLVGIFGTPGCGFTSIQAAVNAVPVNGTIVIEQGTYVENVNIDKNINIVVSNTAPLDCTFSIFGGAPAQGGVIIRPNLATDAVLEIGNNPPAVRDVNISYVTVEDHNGPESNIFVGGGSTVTLTNVVSQDGTNTSPLLGGGGVLVIDNGTLETRGIAPEETRISSNVANGLGVGIVPPVGDGGGIYAGNATVVDMRNSRVSSNQAPVNSVLDGRGGGIFSLGDVMMDSSFVSFNNARGSGGGVYILGAGDELSMENGSRIFSNSSTAGSGAGVFAATDSFLDFEPGTRVSNNTAAAGNGGGIYFSSGADGAIGENGDVQFELWDNDAANGAGMYSVSTDQILIENISAVNNDATDKGGAFFSTAGRWNINEQSCSLPGGGSVDQYCNEFTNNNSVNGGAVAWIDGGQFDLEQAYLNNNDTTSTGNNGTVLHLANSPSVNNIERSLFRGQNGTSGGGQIVQTGTGTTTLVAITFTDNGTLPVIDQDGGTMTTSRLLIDQTGNLFNSGTYSGTCNVSTTSDAQIPGNLVSTSAGNFTTTDRSAYELAAGNPAIDRCATSEGFTTDIDDRGVQDGDGNNTNLFDAGAFETLPVECNGVPGTVFLADGDVATPGNDVIIGTSGIDNVSGLGGNDRICGFGGADTLNGGNGSDVMYGGAGNDTMGGQGGVDTMFGGDNNDFMAGGIGNDIMYGGDGDDDLRGQGNNDFLFGEAGVDQFFGGSGNDTIQTGTGGNAGTAQVVRGQGNNDIITGSSQNDVLDGGPGLDTLNGLAGNDTLLGGNAADILNGGDGNDTLQGNASADTLNGGNNNDDLFGGPGNDTLNGDAGNDDMDGQGDTDVCNGGIGVLDTATNCETVNGVP